MDAEGLHHVILSAAKNLSPIQLIGKTKERFFAALRMTCELTSGTMCHKTAFSRSRSCSGSCTRWPPWRFASRAFQRRLGLLGKFCHNQIVGLAQQPFDFARSQAARGGVNQNPMRPRKIGSRTDAGQLR